MSKRLVVLIEAAIVAALAMALSFIPDFLQWFSPSYGAIFLVAFALRRGMYPALLSGFIWGLLHFPLGKVYFLSVSQVLIEYIVAFTALGLAGLFYTQFQKALREGRHHMAVMAIVFASVVGVGVRYFWHFVAGFLFWGDTAPEGVSAYWYSFTVNGTAGALTLVLTLVVTILFLRYPKIYTVK